MLAAIALMTGSVFPAMLVGAGNNASGVLGGSSFAIKALGWRIRQSNRDLPLVALDD